MDDLDVTTYISAAVAEWEGVRVMPYRFGGVAFMFGTRELGHLHSDGTLNISFDATIARYLIAVRKASPHPIYHDRGWVVFHIHSRQVAHHGLWLLKLSYVHNRLRHLSQQPKPPVEILNSLRNQIAELGLSDLLARWVDDLLRAVS